MPSRPPTTWPQAGSLSGSLVTLTVTGVARVDGFAPYLDGVLGDPAWRAGTPVLVDFQGLEIGELRYADMEQVVALHAPYLARIGSSPLAVVVSRAVHFGMVRMRETLTGEIFPVQRVFDGAADATRWLDALEIHGPQESTE
jgi:hypothetical protein